MKRAKEHSNSPHRQAMEWLIAIEENPQDEALAERFEDWLEADPLHFEAWNDATDLYSQIGEAENLEIETPPMHSSKSRIWLRSLLLAAACLAIFLAPSIWLKLQSDYQTAIGERIEITLTDSTQVILAPESAIAVDFHPESRSVYLLQGQAYFDVSPNPDRPFVVKAGRYQARVLGTAFNVELAGETTEFAVTHGRVAVAENNSASDSIELTAGEIATGRTGETIQRGTASVEEIKAWTTGRIVARNETFEAVVEQIRPYFGGMIFISDDTLKAKRVTGVYSVENVTDTLRTLAESCGGTLETVSPWVIVLKVDG